MLTGLKERVHEILPRDGFWSLRAEHERNEVVRVRQNVLQPIQTTEDRGAMVTCMRGGGIGYAAVSSLSVESLRKAAARAGEWARFTAGRAVFDFSKIVMPHPRGNYETPAEKPWESASLQEKIALAVRQCARLKTDPRIVDFEAMLWYTKTTSLYLTNEGGEVQQTLHRLLPFLKVTASEGARAQTRSLGAQSHCRQGGLEVLDSVGFATVGPTLAAEALELLGAPNCPSDKMDLLLEADQMHLQIHESIGHPLEMDRILGDERNYAGTSFVKPEFFGTFRYGSDLLNIVFDPTDPRAFASCGFDDDGTPAAKQYLIERGILKRGLGGTISQARSGLPGVSNSRANSWRRPPIDRMGNINLEPGRSTMEQMIAAVERGIYMKANNSWSIDDSRNKFQFGCEYGRLIENGKLTAVVRNPNYRGISQNFWNSLKMVGDASTVQCLGAANCGKGEPNQFMRVGHVTPAALFANVDVFGGD